MASELRLASVGVQDFEAPTGRLHGAGLSGIEVIDDLERRDRLRKMREGKLGSLHSWELVTAVDGPGTRLTVFLAGCPLRCQYCHNPDTFIMKDGQPVTSDELIRRIKRYRRMFKATGGGITLSGGEAMMQPAFVKRIFRGAKELGVHTCLDTSGFLGKNVDDELMDDIDLVLLDVKSGSEEKYKEVTGRELQPTIDFGDRLAEAGKEIWVRFVLVPGLTDDPDNVERVAQIVNRWKNVVTRVEVLPFHQMGKDKWHSLGYTYQLEDVVPPSFEDTEKARNVFRKYGLNVPTF
ncbi:pyruvate formate-lyase-activating protein [Actinotignum urinale]|uniref:pyruvate formate-lyase-activating protein n=1 Tax=Actinotignum urinale TaxID=190146 RepID=UPI00370DB529